MAKSISFRHTHVFCTILLLVASSGQAQVPTTISFQGFLTDGNGVAVTGDVSIDLSLYSSPVDPNAVWSESHAGVTVTNGIYDVLIGSETALDPVDFSVPLFLEIEVESEVQGDRVPLASVPYAFTAHSVANLCNQGDFLNCYTGADVTFGVGECEPGIRKCEPSGSQFGSCTGEVLPDAEACDGLDNDCDGETDEIAACCSQQDNEPNDTEATAVFLGSASDCSPLAQVFGTVATSGDVDWYTLNGLDDFSCPVEPQFNEVSAATLEICAYFQCTTGTGTEVTCNSGSSATSPGGLDGCCSTGGSVNPDVNCTGTASDNATIFVSVQPESTAACEGYSLQYKY